jgi:hypothetical protein
MVQVVRIACNFFGANGKLDSHDLHIDYEIKKSLVAHVLIKKLSLISKMFFDSFDRLSCIKRTLTFHS